MPDLIATLPHPDGSERVLIVRRDDGLLTYQRQWRLPDDSDWGVPGSDCGLYDSVQTAEDEARLRIGWLGAL